MSAWKASVVFIGALTIAGFRFPAAEYIAGTWPSSWYTQFNGWSTFL